MANLSFLSLIFFFVFIPCLHWHLNPSPTLPSLLLAASSPIDACVAGEKIPSGHLRCHHVCELHKSFPEARALWQHGLLQGDTAQTPACLSLKQVFLHL